jgi:hypothetical protein
VALSVRLRTDQVASNAGGSHCQAGNTRYLLKLGEGGQLPECIGAAVLIPLHLKSSTRRRHVQVAYSFPGSGVAPSMAFNRAL